MFFRVNCIFGPCERARCRKIGRNLQGDVWETHGGGGWAAPPKSGPSYSLFSGQRRTTSRLWLPGQRKCERDDIVCGGGESYISGQTNEIKIENAEYQTRKQSDTR